MAARLPAAVAPAAWAHRTFRRRQGLIRSCRRLRRAAGPIDAATLAWSAWKRMDRSVRLAAAEELDEAFERMPVMTSFFTATLR
jgi:hypothetical protein